MTDAFIWALHFVVESESFLGNMLRLMVWIRFANQSVKLQKWILWLVSACLLSYIWIVENVLKDQCFLHVL